MKKVLLLLASIAVIGCNWGGSGCDKCACEAGCCESGTCEDAECSCACTK